MRTSGRVGPKAVAPVLAALVVAAACGDDGGSDGATLIEPFQAQVEDAYEANGRDRSEDFNRGVIVEQGCFVLDQEAAVAVAEALGVDDPDGAEPGGAVFINGPPEREVLSCYIDISHEHQVDVTVGTVPLDRDELLRELQESNAGSGSDNEVHEIDGYAPGLDADHVMAFQQGGGTTFGWVHDGFAISMRLSPGLAEPDAGFQALPTLVEVVETSLIG